MQLLRGFSIIAELTVGITGEWSEESSDEELIWTYLGEIFLVMMKSSRSGILLVLVGQYMGSLGMFGIIVFYSYESIAQSVKEVIKVFLSCLGVSGRAIYC